MAIETTGSLAAAALPPGSEEKALSSTFSVSSPSPPLKVKAWGAAVVVTLPVMAPLLSE